MTTLRALLTEISDLPMVSQLHKDTSPFSSASMTLEISSLRIRVLRIRVLRIHVNIDELSGIIVLAMILVGRVM